ncbi:hypothetical protein BJ508DRAFT_329614 [Ascobolus immersus RN42]|uniref:Uncharacterized protein n=1 Tax=Ascobolus immersus RN42 TaxID=1160509 RepID=A0A3N4I1J7_ASCIM|nr:hypothetical protein BJ508DRAFT_329614 [Ascobolus immersus RN42]
MATPLTPHNPLARQPMTPMRTRALLNLQTPTKTPSSPSYLKRSLDEDSDPRGSLASPKRVKSIGITDDIFDTPAKPPTARFILKSRALTSPSASPVTSRRLYSPNGLLASKKSPTASTLQKTPTKRSPKAPASLRRAVSQIRTPTKRSPRTIRRIPAPPPAYHLRSIDDILSSSPSSAPSLTFSSPAPHHSYSDDAFPETPTKVEIKPMREADMPASWFFSIYEQSPDEIRQTVLDHCTSILDLSGDDEDGLLPASRELERRGKENFPPEELDEVLAAADRESQESKVPRTPSKKRVTRSVTRNAVASKPRGVQKKEKKRRALGEMDVQKLYPSPTSTSTASAVPATPMKKPLKERMVKIVEEDDDDVFGGKGTDEGPGFIIFSDEEKGFRMDVAPPSPAGSDKMLASP